MHICHKLTKVSLTSSEPTGYCGGCNTSRPDHRGERAGRWR